MQSGVWLLLLRICRYRLLLSASPRQLRNVVLLLVTNPRPPAGLPVDHIGGMRRCLHGWVCHKWYSNKKGRSAAIASHGQFPSENSRKRGSGVGFRKKDALKSKGLALPPQKIKCSHLLYSKHVLLGCRDHCVLPSDTSPGVAPSHCLGLGDDTGVRTIGVRTITTLNQRARDADSLKKAGRASHVSS
jgi:hypothetical protein